MSSTETPTIQRLRRIDQMRKAIEDDGNERILFCGNGRAGLQSMLAKLEGKGWEIVQEFPREDVECDKDGIVPVKDCNHRILLKRALDHPEARRDAALREAQDFLKKAQEGQKPSHTAKDLLQRAIDMME